MAGKFSSITAKNLENYMSQLQKTLFDELGPGQPREMGTYLLKDFGKVNRHIDTIGCITNAIASQFFLKWTSGKGKAATYGVLKENLSKINRNDLVKTLDDLGKKDKAVVEDNIVMKHVIKKIAPDDLNSMGIHLINNYAEIQQLIKTAGHGPPDLSGQAQAIVNHWITTFPKETADDLMEAVKPLGMKNLLDNLGELLTTIKTKMATDETDAPTKTVELTFPVVPQDIPGESGSDLPTLNKKLAEAK